MRVIIAGSRSATDITELIKAIQESGIEVTVVISGHAHGADLLGEQFAALHNIPLEIYPAVWRDERGVFNKGAGIIRNKKMGNLADAAICLWDGKSPGTRHMIEYMKSLGKPVHVHYFLPVTRDEPKTTLSHQQNIALMEDLFRQ